MLEIKDAIADPAELDRMYPQPASPSIRKVKSASQGRTAA